MPRIPIVVTLLAAAPLAAQAPDAALDTRVRAIHDRVRLDVPNYASELPRRQQVDIPKMERGGLDAALLIVYVGQSPDLTAEGFARANAQAIEKFTAIHRLVDTIAPGRAALARTAADVRAIHASGKRAILSESRTVFPSVPMGPTCSG